MFWVVWHVELAWGVDWQSNSLLNFRMFLHRTGLSRVVVINTHLIFLNRLRPKQLILLVTFLHRTFQKLTLLKRILPTNILWLRVSLELNIITLSSRWLLAFKKIIDPRLWVVEILCDWLSDCDWLWEADHSCVGKVVESLAEGFLLGTQRAVEFWLDYWAGHLFQTAILKVYLLRLFQKVSALVQ